MIEQYIYVFVRKDISILQQIVQASHACHHAGALFGAPAGCNLVLFETENENVLKTYKNFLDSRNINNFVFNENEIEENGSVLGNTAICTEPLPKHYKKLFTKFKMWC